MSLADLERLGAFYLGRTAEGPYLYESRHLTTHGVVIGMTGSGKTGLSVALLEEAAIDGIPAIVVDPKGDLGNLLLTFPALAPEDFAPWVPPGADPAKVAATWKEGLAAWEQDGARIARLRATADVALYTPGSRAGRPLSILASLASPPPDVREDRDAVAERVSQVATSLLGLVGVKAEPGRSREHALVSAILARAWAAGEDLDVAGLVARVQDPPFTTVGVLDLESFFPKKERFELAVAYNALLASPGFEAWLEGEPLDVQALLWTKEGKPRISVLSIAHLGEAERMFFVSLLLGEIVTWMRRQPGTPSLRALFFMDEVVGYFPPVAVPPSKPPLLLLLKQARAYGLGIVLATQNPVDLDYKGLSNAGTWLIGRLQTERDKARVIEGLEGAASGGGFDRGEVERVLAGLQKRHFYVHCVHEDAPVILESRWAMSYLRGPLTREEIKKLSKAERGSTSPTGTSLMSAARAPNAAETGARPVLPPGVDEVFFPTTKPSPSYRPVVVGAARVSFEDARSSLDFSREVMFVTAATDGPVAVRWEDAKWAGHVQARELRTEPAPGARFATPAAAMLVPKSYAAWSKELAAWLSRTQGIARWRYAKTWSLPNEDERVFRARLAQTAREARDGATAKLREKYRTKLEALAEKIRGKHATLQREQAEATAANADLTASAVGSALGMLTGRRGMAGFTSAAKGASRAKKAAGDVTRAKENLDALTEKYRALEAEAAAELAALAAETDPATAPLEHVVTKPKKTGVAVQLCMLAWLPE